MTLQFITFLDDVLFECLEIVADNIGNDWRKLAARLRLPFQQLESTSESMMECFSKSGYLISWSKLKQSLSWLKRTDIIKRIMEETNITTGMLLLFYCLDLMDQFSVPFLFLAIKV